VGPTGSTDPLPATDGNLDLGSSSKRWRNIYANGTLRGVTALTAVVGGSGTGTNAGTSGNHQSGYVGNVLASLTPNVNYYDRTIFNDNLTDNSIVIVTLQGNALGSGTPIPLIVTPPTTASKSFTVRIQARTTTNFPSPAVTMGINYLIIN